MTFFSSVLAGVALLLVGVGMLIGRGYGHPFIGGAVGFVTFVALSGFTLLVAVAWDAFLRRREVTRRVTTIIASIKQAYGDLDRPDYSFQERALKKLRKHALIAAIQKEYQAKDITDLNNDQALHLQIDKPPAAMLCLSLVVPWAMVFRISPENQLYECVLDMSATDLSALEMNTLSLLEQHGFTVVTREEAATPIKMNLFSTDRSDVRVYHALIADDGVIPAVLEG